MKQNPLIRTFCCVAFAGILSTSCAVFSVESRTGETTDIAVFTEDAISTARKVGLDQTLVVFDIDNTLLAMEQGLGADQWYEWQKELANEDPCHVQAVENRLAIQGSLFFASAMRPTQPDSAALLRSIQDSGIRVIALTSRGVEFRLSTFRELRRNGFDFRRTAIGPDGGWDETFIPVHGIRPARYEDGVFLTAGQHKGVMLKDLLDKSNTPLPSAILILDDKQANLDAIVETFSALDVPVRAWRYSGEDENVANFNPDQAYEMLEELLPAMRTIQKVFGTDHYDLPENTRAAHCD
ncbi:MAG: hypothetical protein ACI9H8_001603 [Lysobacterales bacterium]|jgi:hypothetical protein